MSASLGLYRLQKVDTQLDRALARLNTIKQTLENDIELKQALAAAEAAEAEQAQARSWLAGAEAEAEKQRLKIQEVETNLYGGTTSNPKALQEMQSDLVSLKKHLTTLEERQLEAMIRFEKAESVLDEARGGLESVQAKLGDEHKKLLDEQSMLMQDLERLKQERAACATPVEAPLLEVYEDLRKQKRGLAVAELSEGQCGACGSAITAAAQQNAKSAKQLAHCPTCGRILYAS